MNIEERLLTINSYSRTGEKQNKIENIVVHWVGNANTSAIANRNYFENLKSTHTTQASAHYIIGLKGEIIRCIPENEVAFHSGNSEMNRKSIGIENCHPDWNGKFNSNTYNSLVELCVDICKRYGLNENNIIRHYDVTGKECPKYYVKNPNEWNKFKEDVRKKLQNNVQNEILDIFDANLYNSNYLDLQKAFGGNEQQLKAHYLSCGIKEGRRGSYVFDVRFYLEKYNDLKVTFGNDYWRAYEHFLKNGIHEGRQASEVFDVIFYKNANKDLINMSNADALKHYLQFGINEGRPSSSEFYALAYKSKYEDLRKSLGNNMKEYAKHYMQFGKKEGRRAV